MTGFPLSEQDRVLVIGAVQAAEAGTDGEIVTIITQRSDDYRDIGLAWAAMAALLVIALMTLMPSALDDKITFDTYGWGEPPTDTARVLILLVLQIVAFGAVFVALQNARWRVRLTSAHVRALRVRRRAIRYFKVGAEKRTAARVGVLLYLSLDERLAEIVADAAIHAKVPPERWGDAMVALVDEVKAGRPAQGMAAAVAAIGAIIAEHFPKTEGDRNELPDRLIEL